MNTFKLFTQLMTIYLIISICIVISISYSMNEFDKEIKVAKQTKITKSARGEDCTLMLGNCSSNDTVVLCHIGKNRGMGYKCGDHFAVYACSNCHDVIDGRSPALYGFDMIDSAKMIALERTQQKLIDKGLLVIA